MCVVVFFLYNLFLSKMMLSLVCSAGVIVLFGLIAWAGGYKTFFMLNSIEHEIFPAHKC